MLNALNSDLFFALLPCDIIINLQNIYKLIFPSSTQKEGDNMTNKNQKHPQFVWMIAICLSIIAVAVLFTVPQLQVSESEDRSIAGNAYAGPNPCKGKANGYVLEQCPTANGLQKYCQNQRVVTRACPSCQGAAPGNAGLCAGDDTGLLADANRVLVAACGAPKCEYTCNAGYFRQNGVCVLATCQGALPSDAALCAGDDTGLLANTNRTTVAACGEETKCEDTCNAGFTLQNGQCVAVAVPACQGATPSNSTLCAGDDTGLFADANRIVVDACTDAVKCEYTCDAGYIRQNGVCVIPLAPTCQGITPSNASMCIGDDLNLIQDTNRILVAACTEETKCEYACNAGLVLQDGVCITPPFDFSIDASPGSESIARGASASTTVTVSLTSGSTLPVTLSYTGCPQYANCSFSPVTGLPTYSSVFSVNTINGNGSMSPLGTHNILLKATRGATLRTTTYTLIVN